ncbi:hypothetical protein PIROE2DRAFT_8296 [Piromyces sp. E2]|nr:hypothetical protein PIROE2DRAFT_8296 [Piromyces sp. E2]|eukprot:OUM64834.1 hypothetical protein PIROE2DRAFT_8296 [Piromyces sp. E2]
MTVYYSNHTLKRYNKVQNSNKYVLELVEVSNCVFNGLNLTLICSLDGTDDNFIITDVNVDNPNNCYVGSISHVLNKNNDELDDWVYYIKIGNMFQLECISDNLTENSIIVKFEIINFRPNVNICTTDNNSIVSIHFFDNEEQENLSIVGNTSGELSGNHLYFKLSDGCIIKALYNKIDIEN